MSSTIDKHERKHVEKVQGFLCDPISKYDKWAYWCPVFKGGWHSTKCNCPKDS